MYLTRKNNALFIVGILVAMLIVGPILFFVLHPERFMEGENKNVNTINQVPVEEKKAPFDENKPVRSQEEIRVEYEKNISRLLSVFNTEEDSDAILSQIEAGFFDIFVPNEKRDLHFKTLLQIQKLKLDGSIDSKEKLRDYVVPLLNALLDRAQKN